MRFSFCTACSRYLDSGHVPWHSRIHEDEMDVNEWMKNHLVHGVSIPSGTELVSVCPRCSGEDILEVVMVPRAGRAARHVMEEDGIAAEGVRWDDGFDRPPNDIKSWCQDCETYIVPEWRTSR